MARASRQPKRAPFVAKDDPEPMQVPLVIVCEDERPIGALVARTCEALGIRVEVMAGCSRLFEFLHYMQPSAVISDLVLSDQDGFDVMKIVAGYNRDLPLLMVTSDPILLGAVDAIEELWRLSNVWRLESEPTPSALAEFLRRSGVVEPGLTESGVNGSDAGNSEIVDSPPEGVTRSAMENFPVAEAVAAE